MSRKGALWRGEPAQRITECLAGALPAEDLLAWALDHPFFEDREQLSDDEQRLIAQALGTVLQMAPDEPFATRTTLNNSRPWLRCCGLVFKTPDRSLGPGGFQRSARS